MSRPGERYMQERDALEAADMREGRLVRPSHWPADYTPVPGSRDDAGQRMRFGYLRRDGIWVNMPSPGTHIEVGPSEYEASRRAVPTMAELRAEERHLHEASVEAHRLAVEAAQRWVDAEADYARYAPWLFAVIGICFIVGFLL